MPLSSHEPPLRCVSVPPSTRCALRVLIVIPARSRPFLRAQPISKTALRASSSLCCLFCASRPRTGSPPSPLSHSGSTREGAGSGPNPLPPSQVASFTTEYAQVTGELKAIKGAFFRERRRGRLAASLNEVFPLFCCLCFFWFNLPC